MSSAVRVCLVFLVALSAKAQTAHPYESDPKFKAAWHEAEVEFRQTRYEFSLDSYRKANKIAGGECPSCLTKIIDLEIGLKKWKDALKTAEQMKATASTPREKSFAEGYEGEILLRQGGEKPKPEQLAAAHTALTTALSDNPKNITALYTDACVLARQGKSDEASQQFSACADSASPKDPMRLRAQHFAQNPALSFAKMAPPFEVTALDGSHFTLDAMGGRVVLIDFWATWCGPCNEELPQLKKIAKDFAGQPLVMISISWDADEAKWKAFIDKNQMTWAQYRDADHKLSTAFGIHEIPHYFTIDADGVLTAEVVGSGEDVEGKLKKLLKRARESKPPANSEVASAAQ